MTQTSTQTLRDSKFARWSALGILSFTMMCAYYFTDVMAPLKGLLINQLQWTSTEYGLFTGAYSWFNVFLLLLIVGGVILDKMGVRFTGIMSTMIMILGAVIKYWAISTSSFDILSAEGVKIGAVEWTLPLLGLTYKAQVWLAGIGFAIFGVGIEIAGITVSKAIVKWFKGQEMALAMGLQMAMARIGTGLALATTFPLADRVFHSISGPILLGVVLLCIGLIAFIFYTFRDIKLDKQLAILHPKSANVKEEQFKFSDIFVILTNRAWWYIALLCVLFYSAVFPFLKYAPDLMTNKFGVDPDWAGIIPSLLPFGTILLTPFFGNMYDRVGKGASIMLLGSLLLIIVHGLFAVPYLNSWLFAVLLTIVLGIAFSLVPSAMWPSVPKIIPEHQLGTAYSLIFWVQNWGLMGVPLLIGYILDQYCITERTMVNGVEHVAYNYTIPMLCFMSFGILAMVFAFLLKREDKLKAYGLELPNMKR